MKASSEIAKGVEMNPLADGWCTIKQAAQIKQVPYFTLLSWMIRNNVQTSKVGNVTVVHMDSLKSYVPMRERIVAR